MTLSDELTTITSSFLRGDCKCYLCGIKMIVRHAKMYCLK